MERKASTGSARTGSSGEAGQETLTVKLKNYVPEAINLDAANRAKLQAVANAKPLALIDYWAVEPEYGRKVFCSVWQNYQGNTANDADALRVINAGHADRCTHKWPAQSVRALSECVWLWGRGGGHGGRGGLKAG